MSTSKWRKIRVRSLSGSSTSLTSQCSTSTLGFVRDRQSPAADWRAFRQVLFSVLIRAAESTAMAVTPRLVDGRSDWDKPPSLRILNLHEVRRNRLE